jgi:hypothetical protein
VVFHVFPLAFSSECVINNEFFFILKTRFSTLFILHIYKVTNYSHFFFCIAIAFYLSRHKIDLSYFIGFSYTPVISNKHVRIIFASYHLASVAINQFLAVKLKKFILAYLEFNIFLHILCCYSSFSTYLYKMSSHASAEAKWKREAPMVDKSMTFQDSII